MSNSHWPFNSKLAATSQALRACDGSKRSHPAVSARVHQAVNARKRMNHTNARFVSSRNRAQTQSSETAVFRSSSHVNSGTVSAITSHGRDGKGVVRILTCSAYVNVTRSLALPTGWWLASSARRSMAFARSAAASRAIAASPARSTRGTRRSNAAISSSSARVRSHVLTAIADPGAARPPVEKRSRPPRKPGSANRRFRPGFAPSS